MIKLNNAEAASYTLTIATEADLKDEAIKAAKDVFFDNANKRFLLKLNPKRKDQRKELAKQLGIFVKKNTLNVNVAVDEFVKTLINKETFGEEKIFNTIVETIGFNSHEGVMMKKEAKEPTEVMYNLVTTNSGLEALFEKEMIKVEFVNYARDLQDTPPNIGTSEYYAEKISKDVKNIPNLKLRVLGLKDAQKLNMGLFLGVNAGSYVEPQVVVLEYTSDSSLPKTALVGKGITFDSGGYNLKPSAYMKGMKFDMSGAAIMISTVMALAKAGAKANVAAVGMFTDNRIGGKATLPESILTSMNGLTVEIDNTDAEGRLVLADGMTYAIRELNADRIIETSTLTGAIDVALGPWATGGFTHFDSLWKEMALASDYTGEFVWRLPMFEEHLDAMQATPIADLTNSEPGRQAGSSTAAAFLNEFAEGKPYLHLDIASTADNTTRGTGVMVKTLFELLNK